MNTPQGRTRPAAATVFGLIIALFALPAITTGYRFIWGQSQTTLTYVLRELVLFLVLGVLLWIVRRKEGLSFESIGWKGTAYGRSLLWALLVVVLCIAGLAACFGVIHLLDLPFGGGDSRGAFAPPLAAMLITVIRAGVVEEVFYRGYAISRLKTLTGSTSIAVAVPLVIFAAAHYRQGSGGILIAFVTGAIITAVFMKKRDLLALIVAHFLIDFVPNIVLPLFSVTD